MSELRAMAKQAKAGARFGASTILAIASGEQAAARLTFGLSKTNLDLRLIDPLSADFDGRAISMAQPDIIVIDADLSDATSGGAIESAVNANAASCPVIICAADVRPDAMRRIMRMGAAEVLDANAVDGELLDTIERVLAARAVPHSARVSAFFSARGGVGVSTMAVETAVAIAQRLPANSPGVCLVDLNMHFSVDAALLNVTPNLRPNAKLDPGAIDAQVLDAFLTQHKSRVNVLAPAPDWGQPAISMECIARLLDLAAERFAHVVIDLPKDLGTLTDVVMSSADQFYILTDMTVPGLQLTRSVLLAVDSRIGSGCQVSVIVNRLSKWEKGVSLGARDVHRLLPCQNIHFIYEDTETTSEATDRGEPILSLRHDSRLAREIVEAVGAALPANYGAPRAKSSRPSGFLNLAKYR